MSEQLAFTLDQSKTTENQPVLFDANGQVTPEAATNNMTELQAEIAHAENYMDGSYSSLGNRHTYRVKEDGKKTAIPRAEALESADVLNSWRQEDAAGKAAEQSKKFADALKSRNPESLVEDWADAELANDNVKSVAIQDEIQSRMESSIAKGGTNNLTNDRVSQVIDGMYRKKEQLKAEKLKQPVLENFSGALATHTANQEAAATAGLTAEQTAKLNALDAAAAKSGLTPEQTAKLDALDAAARTGLTPEQTAKLNALDAAAASNGLTPEQVAKFNALDARAEELRLPGYIAQNEPFGQYVKNAYYRAFMLPKRFTNFLKDKFENSSPRSRKAFALGAAAVAVTAGTYAAIKLGNSGGEIDASVNLSETPQPKGNGALALGHIAMPKTVQLPEGVDVQLPKTVNLPESPAKTVTNLPEIPVPQNKVSTYITPENWTPETSLWQYVKSQGVPEGKIDDLLSEWRLDWDEFTRHMNPGDSVKIPKELIAKYKG